MVQHLLKVVVKFKRISTAGFQTVCNQAFLVLFRFKGVCPGVLQVDLEEIVVDEAGDVRKQLRAQIVGVELVGDERDLHVVIPQEVTDRVLRDPQGIVVREAEGAARDQGKGNGAAAV